MISVDIMTLLKFLFIAIWVLLACDLSVAEDDYFICPEVLEYDASTPGTISSPFYGKRSTYPRTAQCEYKIRAPEGYRIKITFKDLDIPEQDDDGVCKLDRLLIYSKDEERSKHHYCGNKLPKPLVSKKGVREINVMFHAGGQTQGGRGFLLEYKSFPESIVDEDDENENPCEETFEYDASTPGTVSSPFYGKRHYHNNLMCFYKITAPKGYRIKLTFKDLDIPEEDEEGACILDRLIVYSRNKEIARRDYCGDELPKPLVIKKGVREIDLMFHATNNTQGGRGFLLEYKSIPESTIDKDDEYQCEKTYEYDATTPGTVSSPFYGERPYYNNLFCRYKITAPEGYRIKVTFKDLDIQSSGTSCQKDSLVIFSQVNQAHLGLFCGSRLPRPLLSKEGENEIKLWFRTDSTVTRRGFLITYEASPYFKSVCEDGLTQCRNRFCYKSEQKCDGVDDCGDGTDEEDCGKPIDTNPEICGVQEIKPDTRADDADRIVGGQEAIPNSWPWQVSLQYINSEPSNHFCGGTLINEQWVMTALHCISALRYPGTLTVRIGAHNLQNRTEYEQVRVPLRIIAYPGLENDDIRKGTMMHDFALLKLNAPVKFNKGVQPACLPSPDMHPQPGWVCYSTGWGETRGTGSSGRLKQTDMIVKSRDDCGYYEESQICVGKPYHSTCHGDSGSPINCKVNGKWYSYGALSLLVPTNYKTGQCSGPKAITLYTSSAIKSDWIKETIAKNS